jgi:hypothetical protein
MALAVALPTNGDVLTRRPMILCGLPTRWAPAVEARIVGQVHELARQVAQ